MELQDGETKLFVVFLVIAYFKGLPYARPIGIETASTFFEAEGKVGKRWTGLLEVYPWDSVSTSMRASAIKRDREIL